MKNKIYTLFLFSLLALTLQSKELSDSIRYSVEANVHVGTGDYAPFLSTVNRYDVYSFQANSLNMMGEIHKDLSQKRWLDYGFGLDMIGNIAKNERQFYLGEYYLEAKVSFLQLYLGSKREVFGNQDTELSSGGFLWSKNSRPMPKIAIQTNGYVDVPFTKSYIAVKGGLSHGWFNNNTLIQDLLLHHKYGAIKLGGKGLVALNYEFHHVAQWGGTSTTWQGTMPVTFDNYKRIFMGKSGSSTANLSDQINTLGNHIISQNLGLDVKLKSANISFYWQNITEDPPVFPVLMYKAFNVKDGLWGLSVKFANFTPIKSFVFEYMQTTDRSGPWHDKDGVIYGGADSYFNNGAMVWAYQNMTIGHPWLSSPRYNENGVTTIENNTVRLYYFSGIGTFKPIDYRLTLAYSENFGTNSMPSYDNFKKQFSYQLETSMAIKFLRNTKATFSIAGDKGRQYGDNFAIQLGIRYTDVFGL